MYGVFVCDMKSPFSVIWGLLAKHSHKRRHRLLIILSTGTPSAVSDSSLLKMRNGQFIFVGITFTNSFPDKLYFRNQRKNNSDIWKDNLH